MKTAYTMRSGPLKGYAIIECLVYIGVLFVIFGVGFAALYRCVNSALVLRENSEELARALQVGERWRAEVRSAVRGVDCQGGPEPGIVRLKTVHGVIDYRFGRECVERRDDSGTWVVQLKHVKASRMVEDRRLRTVAWKWELELTQHAHGQEAASRSKPLLAFLAVPGKERAP